MLELVFSVEVVHFGCVFDTLPCYLQFVLQILLLVATPVLVLLLLVGVYLGEFDWGYFGVDFRICQVGLGSFKGWFRGYLGWV